MTRNELIRKWCAAEGGKVSALNAPQAREAYAKLRAIIGEETGVDLDDILAWECCGLTADTGEPFEAFRVWPWRNGKPAKPARKRG